MPVFRHALVLAALTSAAFAETRPPVTVDAPVHAETPEGTADPFAERAGEESNLATEARRQGFWMHLGFGPSITIGGGTGAGAGVSLLLGAVMRPTYVAFLGFTYNGQAHSLMGERHINDYTSALVGFQWWPAGAAYARFGAGFGAYRCKECQNPDEPTNPITVDYDRRGITGSFAVGIDLVRTQRTALGVETASVTTITRDGAIVSLCLQAFMSID